MDGHEFEKAEIDALERVVGDRTAQPISLTFWLLRRITKGFSTESEIGRGGFAIVYLGVLPNGLRIAVKRFLGHSVITAEAFENEVSTTMRCAHKNIVRLIGYCHHTQGEAVQYNGETVFAESRERLMCMEYHPKGTLDRYTDIFHGGLDWNFRYQIFKEVCQGLSYLHEETHTIHGDLKPRNILLDDYFVPKIFDFGLSRRLKGESFIISEAIVGTLQYMAPELITGGHLSCKSDIFSLGVTIIQLLIGHKWNRGHSVEQDLTDMRKRLVKERAFASWENKYQQVRKCLEIGYSCMAIDPIGRPTALEIIQLLDETESTNVHAPAFWQSGDEESDSLDTDATEPERTPSDDILSGDEELASADMDEETSTHEHDKTDLISKLSVSPELSSLDFLDKITDGFSHEYILGKEATFGVVRKTFVYKGNISGRTMVVVKRLIGVDIPVEKFEREAKRFMSLDHKNIVKLLGYYQDKSRGYKLVKYKGIPLPQKSDKPEQLLCYEYMQNGSLREYIIGQGSREVDWHMRYKLIKGTCKGLQYLHEGHRDCRIVHLNLSPSNVLLDENNTPRITGFDFSKLIGEKNTKSMVLKMNGPIAYLPPDFLHSKGTDLKYLATVDIYSLGLMILEIATQQEIKGDHGILIKSVEKNWREDSKIASLYTSLEVDKLWQVKLCIDIGLHCVKSRPERRPTAGEIIIWLDKRSKPVPLPVPRPGVPRPPVRTNITDADDCIQGKEKQTGFIKRFGWK